MPSNTLFILVIERENSVEPSIRSVLLICGKVQRVIYIQPGAYLGEGRVLRLRETKSKMWQNDILNILYSVIKDFKLFSQVKGNSIRYFIL
jgi:hypothetical protein